MSSPAVDLNSAEYGPFDPSLVLAMARTIDPEAWALTLVEPNWMRIALARQVANATALRILMLLTERGDLTGSEKWRPTADSLSRSMGDTREGGGQRDAVADLLGQISGTRAFMVDHVSHA